MNIAQHYWERFRSDILGITDTPSEPNREWNPMTQEPRVEGPYLVRVDYSKHPTIKARNTPRYRIKRWNFVKKNGCGYFSKGGAVGGEYTGWLPIPGHNYFNDKTK